MKLRNESGKENANNKMTATKPNPNSPTLAMSFISADSMLNKTVWFVNAVMGD